MSLDLSKLERLVDHSDYYTARCPACAEQDRDTKGEHLIIYPEGQFACVLYPEKTDPAGASKHQKRIWALVGDKNAGGSCSARRKPIPIPVRRPACALRPPRTVRTVYFDSLGKVRKVGIPVIRAGKRRANPSDPSDPSGQPRFDYFAATFTPLDDPTELPDLDDSPPPELILDEPQE